MTDLQDRLDRLAPTVDPDTGLGDLLGRVRRRRQRRRVGAGVVASVALVGSVLGAVAVLDAGDESGTRVVTEPSPGRPVVDEGWVELPDAPLPQTFEPATAQAIWTGDEFLWWGIPRDGASSMVGAAFDPDEATWRPMAEAPIRARLGATVIWTGTEMVVWGGSDAASGFPYSGARYDPEGAAYDPATDSWRRIAPAPVEPREGAAAAWTGDRLVVAGGERYDGAPECPDRETCLAQGQVGAPTSRPLLDGAAYDPLDDRWEAITDAPAQVGGVTTWDGNELLTFGGPSAVGGDLDVSTGQAYDPSADAWRPLEARTIDGVLLDDPRLTAAGGEVFALEATGTSAGTWYRYDTRRNRWVPTTQVWVPDVASGVHPVAVRAGAAIVVMGGGQVAYNPATDSWIDLDAYPGVEPGQSFDVVTAAAVGAGDNVVMVYGLVPFDPRQEPPDPAPEPARFVAYQGDFSVYTVPDVVGLTLGEARRIMADAGFVLAPYERDPQGDDAVVRAQEPPGGTEVLGLTPEVGVRTDLAP